MISMINACLSDAGQFFKPFRVHSFLFAVPFFHGSPASGMPHRFTMLLVALVLSCITDAMAVRDSSFSYEVFYVSA